jgi:undecaprenyl-diphosphatase
MTVRAVWRQVEARDYGLMLRVHRWLAPRPLQVLMVAATRLGDGWLWWMLGVALLFFGGPHRFVAISAGAAAAGAGILIFCGLKHTSRRRRPFELVPHCWSTIPPPDRYSFPSGHTITAFAVALSIGPFYPTLMMALVVTAVMIAVSRILLGMHFLTDVVAGSIIGITLGRLSFHIFRFHFFHLL